MLSGDAIVNESMLTGESVPVSKYPVDPPNIQLISRPGGEIAPDLSRHVVFSGTKIIRIRKTSPPGIPGGDPEALAMVIRTGACSLDVRATRVPLISSCFRLQHDQRSSCAIHVVPETVWIRFLSRFIQVHRRACDNCCRWIPRKLGQFYQARGECWDRRICLSSSSPPPWLSDFLARHCHSSP